MQPIRMTPELIRQITSEVCDKASKMTTIQNTNFSFSKTLVKVEKNVVEVNFTPEAYDQMFALINHFDSEVAWHGLVNRIDDTHFQVMKILVYPQKVTGATVNTDYEKYQPWLYALSDDDFNSVRFQGHSHVNMATNPSSVDIENQWNLINNLGGEDYYIFMIWNKRREYNVRVVDMKKNVIYSGKDVKVTIGLFDSKSFLEDAEKMVEKPAPYKYGNTNIYTGGPFNGDSETIASSKTVIGASAPKIRTTAIRNSNLANYYAAHPEALDCTWNSSCYPYMVD